MTFIASKEDEEQARKLEAEFNKLPAALRDQITAGIKTPAVKSADDIYSPDRAISVEHTGGPYDSMLLNLTTANSSTNLPKIPEPGTGFFTNTRTGEITQVGTPDKKKETVKAPTGATIPDATSIKSPVITDMIGRLKGATTDAEKIDIAFALKNAAQSQALTDYNRFVKQAEIRYGIPDIEMGIDAIAKQEALDPNRPVGMMSDQRQMMLNQLGEARTRTTQYVNELMKGNVEVQQAILAADSVLNSFKLEDDKVRIHEMRGAQLAKEQQKVNYLSNPTLLNRLTAITTGIVVPTETTRSSMAQQLVNNPKSVDDRTMQLAQMGKEQLFPMLFLPDKEVKPQDKQKIRNMLLAEEIANTGDEAKARANIALVDKVASMRLSEGKLAEVSLLFSEATRDKVSEVVNEYRTNSAAAAKDAKAKDLPAAQVNDRMLTEEIEVKNKLLRVMATNEFNNNVRSWKGLIQADPTASAILSKVDVTKPYTAQEFVGDYLNSKDDKSLQDKITTLRNIVQQAGVAYDKGSVLPPVNPAGLEAAIDRMAVATIVNPFRYMVGITPLTPVIKGAETLYDRAAAKFVAP